ncbi:MAG: hypothetical protein KJ607_08695 [Bacteroidetes bacterium]|nr:hypothetical protein [Bacteroidota bacterium]
MKRPLLCILWSIFLYGIFAQNVGTGADPVLPQHLDALNIRQIETPDVFTGQDLYLLIDGGADIFLEYGFSKVVFAKYRYAGLRKISAEVYYMDNDSAAYGIYSLKKCKNGKIVDVGDEGFFCGSYLTFWKSNCMAQLSGFEKDSVTEDIIIEMGRTIAEKITGSGHKPALMSLLPGEGLRNSGYVTGKIGLSNLYYFDYEDIFGIKECAVGEYGSTKLFLMRYSDNEECMKWFDNAMTVIKACTRFSDLSKEDSTFIFTDHKGNSLRAGRVGEYLLIVLAKSVAVTAAWFPRIFQEGADN